jgi:hypothetical protein
LETEISQENMWWARAEANIQEQKKRRRLEKKEQERASQSPAPSQGSSQGGSQGRQTTLDDVFEKLAAKAVEDDQQPEIVLDADAERDNVDMDD